MQGGVFPAVALAALVLVGGCAGGAGPGTAPPREPSTTVTPAPESTAPPTSTATTPAPVTSLPSPSACLTDAVPRPDPVDGVEPSTYPEPPATVTRTSLVNWTQAFETAYFRNAMLADEPGDDEQILAEVSAYAEPRSVTHTARGYVIRFSDSGATNYESGIHGDRWADVGYVVNETRVVRVPLTDGDDPVRASEGTVVVGCR